MRCPACRTLIEDREAWFCPACDHILDLSVLAKQLLPKATEEQELADAAEVFEGSYESAPDAVIVGDLDDEEEADDDGEPSEASMIPGAALQDGRVAGLLLYASKHTSRALQPSAVPVVANRDVTIPGTPIENFVLSCVDGRRTIRDIQRAAGLASHEITAAVLMLLDKGLIAILPEPPPPDPEEPGRDEDAAAEEAERDAFDVGDKTMPPASAVVADEFGDEVHTVRVAVPAQLIRPPIVAALEPEEPDGSLTQMDTDAEVEGFEPLTQVPDDAFASGGREWEPAGEVSKTMPPVGAVLREPPPRASLPQVGPPPLPSRPPPLPVVAPIAPLSTPPKSDVPMVLGDHYLLELGSTPPEPVKSGASPRPRLGLKEPPPLDVPSDTPVLPVRAFAGDRTQAPRGPERVPLSLRGPIVERKSDPRVPPDASQPMPRLSEPPPLPPTAQEVRAAQPVEPSAARPRTAAEGDLAHRARKLFDQAMQDRADGDLVSAQMNVKLAITFDPREPRYARALEELKVELGGGAAVKRGAHKRSAAQELFDKATEREAAGKIDEAVELLEKALRQAKEPAFYNRLGVILAMRKREYRRGREMIEKALELAPNNSTYKHNLGKILARAAEADLEGRAKKDGGKRPGGFLGLFGGKKTRG